MNIRSYFSRIVDRIITHFQVAFYSSSPPIPPAQVAQSIFLPQTPNHRRLRRFFNGTLYLSLLVFVSVSGLYGSGILCGSSRSAPAGVPWRTLCAATRCLSLLGPVTGLCGEPRTAESRPYVGKNRRGRRPRRPVERIETGTGRPGAGPYGGEAPRFCHCEPVRTLARQSASPVPW